MSHPIEHETLLRMEEKLGLSRKRRRFAHVEIKLLRLSLVERDASVCQGIGLDWSSAQPTQNLSPFLAANSLKVAPWSVPSEVRSRYRKLQLRYPPEQVADRHADWRPAAELLGSPVQRLNWYWLSGLVPGKESATGCLECVGLFDDENPWEGLMCLSRMCEDNSKN